MRLTGEAHGDTSMEAINDMELGYTVDAAGRRGEIQIRHEGRRRMVVPEYEDIVARQLVRKTTMDNNASLTTTDGCGKAGDD
uniref:Uncharacterized protein n=1 Tax=Cucumis sativus TaxID=3659 RepID=A0A0A0KFE4_CUCSA